jgi:orotidine-5'-phosphate decarboxylase
MPVPQARERLIVALDLESAAAARAMAGELDGVVDFFKIGLTLQLAPGIEQLIHDLVQRGKKLFLDYKYYDIAETVRKAVARAAEIGVHFLTVHGTSQCIQGAIQGRGQGQYPLIFVVTVLTSHDQADMAELGYTQHTVEQLVLHRARKALEAGCDGVIASGQEAAAIKGLLPPGAKSLLVVTPGIRPDGYPEDDQKRRTTPRDAILAGADYLVVGRPITHPRSSGFAGPREAATSILQQMQAAFEEAHPRPVS